MISPGPSYHGYRFPADIIDHAACADLGGDGVRAEGGAGFETHEFSTVADSQQRQIESVPV